VIFSIDDLFTVGAGLDVAGAYVLGRGLLASPATIVRRSNIPYGGSSFATGAGQIADRVDAIAGIATLVTGFTVQASAYVLLIGFDLSGGRGWARGLAASACAVAAVATALTADRCTRWPRLRRQIVEYARHDPTGDRHVHPSAGTLIRLGQEFGRYPQGKEPFPGGGASYARRVFGVREVRDDLPSEIFGMR
jgi:hypothetical protein